MLRALRCRAGLTQRQLADLSGLSVRAIRDLEHGRVHRPRRESVRLLANALWLEGAQRATFTAAAAPAAHGTGPLPEPAAADVDDEVLKLAELLVTEQRRLAAESGVKRAADARMVIAVARQLRPRSDWSVLWVTGASA
jgi:transcriptional regulator with XRE-family HTH domain